MIDDDPLPGPQPPQPGGPLPAFDGPFAGAATAVGSVIWTFLRTWRDDLAPGERNAIDLPTPVSLDDDATGAVEARRAWMVADWMVRVQTAAWLRLIQATAAADALSGLAEVARGAGEPAFAQTLRDACKAAVDVRDGVWSTPATAPEAGLDVEDAERLAASTLASAAMNAARTTVWTLASLRVHAGVWNIAHETARAAAQAAVGLGGPEALRATCEALQRSAARLVARMIEAGPAAPDPVP
jgi:hypothetical protein